MNLRVFLPLCFFLTLNFLLYIGFLSKLENKIREEMEELSYVVSSKFNFLEEDFVFLRKMNTKLERIYVHSFLNQGETTKLNQEQKNHNLFSPGLKGYKYKIEKPFINFEFQIFNGNQTQIQQLFFYYNEICDWIFFPKRKTIINNEKNILLYFYNVIFKDDIFSFKNKKMIDIGSNTGIFGLIFLRNNFQVDFWDPQPLCIRRINETIIKNNLQTKEYSFRNYFLGKENKNVTIQSDECSGKFELNKKGTNNNHLIEMKKFQSIYNLTVDFFEVIKIDTEGSELTILNEILPFFVNRNINRVIVELTPIWWARYNYTLLNGVSILKRIVNMNYKLKPWVIDKRFDYLEGKRLIEHEDIENYLKNINIQTDLLIEIY